MVDEADQSRAEAEQYLELVVQELKRRESSLRGVEREIADLTQRLAQVSLKSSLLKGDATLLTATERFRQNIRAKLVSREKERIALQEEVRMALERRRLAEERLSESE